MTTKNDYFLNGINAFLGGKTYTDLDLLNINEKSSWQQQAYKKGYIQAKELTQQEHLHDGSFDSVMHLHFKFQNNGKRDEVFNKNYIRTLRMKSLMLIERKEGSYA